MRHKEIAKVLLVILLSGVFLTSVAQIKLITGFQGGSYFQMGADIEKIMKYEITIDTNWAKAADGSDSFAGLDKTKSPFVKVVTSKGSKHNFNIMMRNEKAVVAFMQFDVLFEEQLKDMKKYNKRTDSLRILAPIGLEEIHLITLKKNKYNSLASLKKKRVAIGAQTQGTAVTAGLIKEKTGIMWEDVHISFQDALHALMTDKIDAFFFVGSAPVKDLNGLSPTYKKLAFVPIKHKNLEDLYVKTTIPANSYHWLEKDVETFAVRTVLVCDVTKETKEDQIRFRKFLKELQNNISKLQEEGHPNWKKVDFNYGDLPWEAHDVAKKVFGL